MRNMAAALLLAHGVPMLTMGDEYGHTKGGNNNTYCHDSELNWFDWDALGADKDGFARFVRQLVRLRRSSPLLRRAGYVGEGDVTWHGEQPNTPDWSEASRLVAYTLHDDNDASGRDLYIAFNTGATRRGACVWGSQRARAGLSCYPQARCMSVTELLQPEILAICVPAAPAPPLIVLMRRPLCPAPQRTPLACWSCPRCRAACGRRWWTPARWRPLMRCSRTRRLAKRRWTSSTRPWPCGQRTTGDFLGLHCVTFLLDRLCLTRFGRNRVLYRRHLQ